MRITSLCMTYFFSQVKQKWLTSLVEEKKNKTKTRKTKEKTATKDPTEKAFLKTKGFCKHQPSNVNFKLKNPVSPPSINPVHVQPGIKVEMFDA